MIAETTIYARGDREAIEALIAYAEALEARDTLDHLEIHNEKIVAD